VDSITRGIANPNASPSTQGLPSVNPVYTWVRLAQRVPVRIAVDVVPPGVPLVAGMTATITVQDPAQPEHGGFQAAFATLSTNLRGLLSRDTRPPTTTDTTAVRGAGTVSSIPAENVAEPALSQTVPTLPLSTDRPDGGAGQLGPAPAKPAPGTGGAVAQDCPDQPGRKPGASKSVRPARC
jgi:hypothetical protein